jgi:hypothetical protein
MRAITIRACPDVTHFLHLPENEFLVDFHSNRVTAAVALPLVGEPVGTVAFLLRWNPVSIKHCLRELSKDIGKVATLLVQVHHCLQLCLSGRAVSVWQHHFFLLSWSSWVQRALRLLLPLLHLPPDVFPHVFSSAFVFLSIAGVVVCGLGHLLSVKARWFWRALLPSFTPGPSRPGQCREARSMASFWLGWLLCAQARHSQTVNLSLGQAFPPGETQVNASTQASRSMDEERWRATGAK